MTLITIINKDLSTIFPIIHNFKEKISHHIIIYDEEKEEERLAQILKQGIGEVNKRYNIKNEIELIKIDEDDKNDLIFLQKKLSLLKDTIYLNSTNADITLTIIVSGYILNNNGYVIAYDKFDNTYDEISKNSFKTKKIENNLKIDEFFLYYGYKKINEYDISAIEKQKSQIEYIFKNTHHFFYNEQLLRKNHIKKINKNFKDALKGVKILDKNDKITYKQGFGTLFEYFVFLKLKNYNFDDLKIGVEVLLDEDLEIKNEFDIIAVKENHLFIIECKLGTKFESNEVIYKLDSIIENFGEDAKGLIVNIHSNEDYSSNFINKKFSKQAHKRAKYNNLEIYSDYFFNPTIFNEIMNRFFEVRLKNELILDNKPIFLIGGYDLEMEEIKNLLIKNNQYFLDKKLKWGAKLSSYAHLLDENTQYYGIELIEDIIPPKNYIAIDHHNKNQSKKSSLEQIADILKIELNRYQTLVSLNDKGYIPAMEEFGATEVEIEYIRQKDRQAQGVTKEDEILAQIAIDEAIIRDGVLVINAKSDKFSPIIDRCYKKSDKILIYNEKKLTYYGQNVEKLVFFYKEEIQKNNAYYGGNFGFFGISEEVYKKEEIKKIKENIIKTVTTA